MDFIGGILYDCLYHAVPILLCVLGGIFAYKANVLNIALEGMMLAGAFVSVLVSFQTGSIVLGYLSAILSWPVFRQEESNLAIFLNF